MKSWDMWNNMLMSRPSEGFQIWAPGYFLVVKGLKNHYRGDCTCWYCMFNDILFMKVLECFVEGFFSVNLDHFRRETKKAKTRRKFLQHYVMTMSFMKAFRRLLNIWGEKRHHFTFSLDLTGNYKRCVSTAYCILWFFKVERRSK